MDFFGLGLNFEVKFIEINLLGVKGVEMIKCL